jgi:Cu+-exporting ATPase
MAANTASKRVSGTVTRRIAVPIYGLTCGGGGSLVIERVVARLEGVKNAYVNPAMEMAYVEYDPNQCSVQDIVGAMERLGFRAGPVSLR